MTPELGHPLTVRESMRLPPGPVFVQVAIAKVPTCARLLDGWVAPDGTFLWSLQLLAPYKGRASFPETRVRTCSTQDGHCTCAAPSSAQKEGTRASGELLFGADCGADSSVSPDPVFFQAGVVAPPEGLIFEIPPVSSPHP